METTVSGTVSPLIVTEVRGWASRWIIPIAITHTVIVRTINEINFIDTPFLIKSDTKRVVKYSCAGSACFQRTKSIGAFDSPENGEAVEFEVGDAHLIFVHRGSEIAVMIVIKMIDRSYLVGYSRCCFKIGNIGLRLLGLEMPGIIITSGLAF